jgi:hypothetical protein
VKFSLTEGKQFTIRSFWQVVMAGGDAADITQGTVNEVVDAINKLKIPLIESMSL